MCIASHPETEYINVSHVRLNQLQNPCGILGWAKCRIILHVAIQLQLFQLHNIPKSVPYYILYNNSQYSLGDTVDVGDRQLPCGKPKISEHIQ
jgi:hypothetical protein